MIGLGALDLEGFREIGKSHGVTVQRTLEEISNNNEQQYSDIRAVINAGAFATILTSLSHYLKSIFTATLYIGPARARSERYYRYQDLAVSEIDPDGKNFPMFLNSLSEGQINMFSSWVKSLFGYGVKLSKRTGHISINLVDAGQETNIVDVGYGVSQILPVLGQIWWAKNRPITQKNRSPLSLLAIEQPELHLHPAHQALLADALVEEATGAKEGRPPRSRLHYIVETHSETLINRLGELIARKRLSEEDIQVVLFEPEEETGNTKVRTVRFNDEGVLIDWPFGFFQPEVY
ncbi:hypothetical protein D3C80_924130 [compost metagenome]